MMEGFRRAALSLSCLRRKDRDWILRNLSSSEGEQLKTLLSELKDTGIEPDTSIVDEVLSTAYEHRVGMQSVSHQATDYLNMITLSKLGNVKKVLAKEPGWLVALVLTAFPGHWRKEYLNDMDPVKRANLKKFHPQLREIKPHVVNMLLMAFVAELSTISTVSDEWLDEIDISLQARKPAVKGNPIRAVLSKWLP